MGPKLAAILKARKDLAKNIEMEQVLDDMDKKRKFKTNVYFEIYNHRKRPIEGNENPVMAKAPEIDQSLMLKWEYKTRQIKRYLAWSPGGGKNKSRIATDGHGQEDGKTES